MIKIFHPGGWYAYKDYTTWLPEHTFVESIEEADLVLWAGGTDVSPTYYNEKHGKYTDNSDVIRDTVEFETFKKAQELGIPCLGICRGSQLLCVASGGKLIQHQQNPQSRHSMLTNTGETFIVTSSHHQAQYPFDMSKDDYEIIGWTNALSKYHLDGEGNELNPEKECEVVFYPKTKALAIQSHPEWMSYNSPTNIYFRELLQKYLALNSN